MESYLTLYERLAKKYCVPEYPNFRQSLHIGLNTYEYLKNSSMLNLTQSHNDVKKMEDLFKNQLAFNSVDTLIDKSDTMKKNFSNRVIQKIEQVYKNCAGVGNNPYTVNIISFCGHGITYNNDNIAVLVDSQRVDREVKSQA